MIGEKVGGDYVKYLRVYDVRGVIAANRTSLWKHSPVSSGTALFAGGGTGYVLGRGLLEGANLVYENFPNHTLTEKAVKAIVENTEYVGYMPLVLATIGVIVVSIALYRKDNRTIANEGRAREILGADDNRLIASEDVAKLKEIIPLIWTKPNQWGNKIASDEEIKIITENEQKLCQTVLDQMVDRSKDNKAIYYDFKNQFRVSEQVASQMLTGFLVKSLRKENRQAIFDFAIECELPQLKQMCLGFKDINLEKVS